MLDVENVTIHNDQRKKDVVKDVSFKVHAGVTHIDVDKVLEDEEYAKHILDYSKEKNVRRPC